MVLVAILQQQTTAEEKLKKHMAELALFQGLRQY